MCELQDLSTSDKAVQAPSHHRWFAGLILCIPAGALLCPSIYNAAEPRLLGVPLFYWWQTLWIALSAVATALAGRLLGNTGRGTSKRLETTL